MVFEWAKKKSDVNLLAPIRKATRSGASFLPEGVTDVSGKSTNSQRRVDQPSRGRADLARLREISDAEIDATSPPELSDLPDDFWDDAEVILPPSKEAISMRVDEDVLEWFRSQGPRYQTRMNAVLRSYMTMTKGRRR